MLSDLWLELHRKLRPGLEYGKAYIVGGLRVLYVGITLVSGKAKAVFRLWNEPRYVTSSF